MVQAPDHSCGSQSAGNTATVFRRRRCGGELLPGTALALPRRVKAPWSSRRSEEVQKGLQCLVVPPSHVLRSATENLCGSNLENTPANQWVLYSNAANKRNDAKVYKSASNLCNYWISMCQDTLEKL